VIDTSRLKGKTVKFGATVKLTDEDSGDTFTYKIVGEDEADISKKKISIASPIARAMIGKEEGDIADVSAPGGSKSYEIVSIAWK
jgi:transcription elongation factor GreA